MNVLVILQGPSYGDERAYNGLRLAASLAQRDQVTVRVFCFGDAVGCAIEGQQLTDGYYHLDRSHPLDLRSPTRRQPRRPGPTHRTLARLVGSRRTLATSSRTHAVPPRHG